MFQQELVDLGYKFQFIMLVGFYVLNYFMFDFVCGYVECVMSVYVELQEVEFVVEVDGYIVIKYQCEVGIGYFDVIFIVFNFDSVIFVFVGFIEVVQFY